MYVRGLEVKVIKNHIETESYEIHSQGSRLWFLGGVGCFGRDWRFTRVGDLRKYRKKMKKEKRKREEQTRKRIGEAAAAKAFAITAPSFETHLFLLLLVS